MTGESANNQIIRRFTAAWQYPRWQEMCYLVLYDHDHDDVFSPLYQQFTVINLQVMPYNMFNFF